MNKTICATRESKKGEQKDEPQSTMKKSAFSHLLSILDDEYLIVYLPN
jgi:hypothetical protein